MVVTQLFEVLLLLQIAKQIVIDMIVSTGQNAITILVVSSSKQHPIALPDLVAENTCLGHVPDSTNSMNMLKTVVVKASIQYGIPSGTSSSLPSKNG